MTTTPSCFDGFASQRITTSGAEIFVRTGGMIAAACTDLSSSNQWIERGIVTYSNEAKAEMLGVPPGLIDQHGAVSEPVARAMADGALAHSRAQVSLAVTGVAGPTGGTEAKPVGTVWLA